MVTKGGRNVTAAPPPAGVVSTGRGGLAAVASGLRLPHRKAAGCKGGCGRRGGVGVTWWGEMHDIVSVAAAP